MGDFEIDQVLYFIQTKGGRVRNHELVTHFKNFLNHPNNKVQNREKFKNFVNELATIKLEGEDKVLVLKRKYRALSDGGFTSPPPMPSTTAPKKNSAGNLTDIERQKQNSQAAEKDSHIHVAAETEKNKENFAQSTERAQSEPPVHSNNNNNTVNVKGDATRPEQVGSSGPLAKTRSQDNSIAEVVLRREDRVHSLQGEDAISTSSSLSLASTTSQDSSTSGTSGFISLDGHKKQSHKMEDNSSLHSNTSQKSSTPLQSSGSSSSVEEDANVSVMDKIKKLNRIQSEVEIQQPKQAPGRKNSKYPGDEDDSHITLGPEEKEWLLVCCGAEYHEMNRLLSKNGFLAKLTNFTNGYTALHWAAKSGKAEIIKLIANKPGLNIDQRSHGGYTALHLAAIHGHEHIIELLVQTYKADANLRDYSGKKAKQYLKNSASSKAQQLLQSRRLGSSDINMVKSLDDSFVRSSMRMSSRAKEMSSLLQAKSSVARQPLMRSSWAGAGSFEDLYEEDGEESSSSNSSHLSPASARRKSEK